MKILLDECVPKTLKSKLSVEGHQCSTVPEAGLGGAANGELLRQAEVNFDVFLTLDKGIHYQQNLANYKIERNPAASQIFFHIFRRVLQPFSRSGPGRLSKLARISDALVAPSADLGGFDDVGGLFA